MPLLGFRSLLNLCGVALVLSFQYKPVRRPVVENRRVSEFDGGKEKDTDILKWERMYNTESNTEVLTGENSFDSESIKNIDFMFESDEFLQAPEAVAVVSFDLDDTLWPTKTVMAAANDALETFMNQNFPDVVEAGRDLVQAKSKGGSFFVFPLMHQIYNERKEKDSRLPNDPVNLTELRKSAIMKAALEASGRERHSPSEASQIAEKCFHVWKQARHKACEEYMFDGVVSSLKRLNDAGFMVGAITNGNADISSIPSLAELFAFSVTSEDVGKSKPSYEPFFAAVSKAGMHPTMDIGRKWVHVGDDFERDCAPAKALKMRTVWVNAASDKPDHDDEVDPPAQRPSKSVALENVPMEQGAYKMTDMGSGDYLAQMVVKDIVDVIVRTPTEAVDVVLQWHSDFETQTSLDVSPPPHLEVRSPVNIVHRHKDDGGDRLGKTGNKFCFECGTQLPREAKFCVECGTRQPVPGS